MAQRDSSTIDWNAAVWAGLIAGAVFMIVEIVMVPVFLDGSPWAPLRMIAAIGLGREVLPPPATFDAGIFIAAMIVHFALSIAFAVVLAWLIFRVGRPAAILIGAAFGLAIYVVNFYGVTAIFPWFADARNWVSIVAHIAFGVVAAWTYVVLAARGAAAGEAGRGDRMAAD